MSASQSVRVSFADPRLPAGTTQEMIDRHAAEPPTYTLDNLWDLSPTKAEKIVNDFAGEYGAEMASEILAARTPEATQIHVEYYRARLQEYVDRATQFWTP